MTLSDLSKLSAQERIKDQSRHLRGQILRDLRSDKVAVLEETYELLKFHGTYEGYNRDTATARKRQGLEKEYEFMVRLKMPGGRLTAQQYLELDKIAGKYANGTLRITTRQTFQMHCIGKGDLWPAIHEINEQLVTTLGGCGDVVRNVICCPAPFKDSAHERMLSDTYMLAKHFAPRTSAYHEIWVDGVDIAGAPEGEEEPVYGEHYMPRKFKIALGLPEDNCMDALCNDLAFFMMYRGQELQGYNVYLGGGLGMNHNQPATYPRVASPVAFVGPNDLLQVAEAVVKLQRDHGDRTNRKHARLKYVVQEKGPEWTRHTLEEYFGRAMQDPLPIEKITVEDHMGWHEQGDGKSFLGIPVSSGRIIDRAEEKIRTGLHNVIAEYGMNLTLTLDQKIILCDVEPKDRETITSKLHAFGIKLKEDVTPVYRFFLACVAFPTCGKALSEAERVKLPLVADIEKVMAKHGILQDTISIRISGCPNGCSRPNVSDIGIIGRMPGHYVLAVGGNFEGTRLNTFIFDKVPLEDIAPALDPMFRLYAAHRVVNEQFGDFCHRYGIEPLKNAVTQELGPQHKWAA